MATRRPRSKAAPAPAPGDASPPALATRRRPGHSHGAGGDIDALLHGACEEAARLLGADGAFLYLFDEETGKLRFTHSAGIAELPPGHWMRELLLPVGVGMFGKAVADRRVVVTGDYGQDERFVHAEATDRFVAEVAIRSMVVAPISAADEVFGALGTFSHTPDAFTAPQIGLVRALADHAALAMANARLIEELAHSREAIERQAIIERSLRELGTRISGARDPEAVVQHTIDEALRLLHGDGARIDIVDPEVQLLRGVYSSGEEQLRTEWPDDPDDRLEVGASGKAVLTGRTHISRDYLTDPEIVHSMGPDTYVRNKGIHGVIASPLLGDQGPFGAITVWSLREDAFGPDDAALLETIAGQASVALGRARLIEELGRSRETLARRAEEERALREIASRLGAMGDDPADVLHRIVNETARLLAAERARLDLVEPLSGEWLWTFPPSTPFNDRIVAEELTGAAGDERPVGLAGLAIAEGRPVVSGDYMRDERFVHYPEGDAGVTTVGLHSIVAAPVMGEDGLLGVLQAGHRAQDAFGDDAIRLIGALASQAAIAITNARLVDRLASSQAALGRTADAERALREIARRLMTIQDPAELLQDVVDEAARLLGSSGAVIDLLDPATGEIRWAYDAGIDQATRTEWQERSAGVDGVFQAIRERRVVVTDDYAADPRFGDGAPNAEFLERAGVRSIAFAPLIGEATVLGTLAVHAAGVGQFGQDHAATLGALADLATIAIHNAELIAELGRSREETARRAETERTLREIAARVTAIRDPDTILGLIVDETRRVLGSDGAHLTRMSEDRTYVRPVVIAGGMDDETRDWLRVQEFPLDGGINGLAAGQGRIVWTPNYATDPRIPRDEDDLEVAERMGLGAMAAAPLHAPGGEVIGTLAISYRTPGPISQDRLAMLQALADHAAIALSNSDLLARLEASEGQLRRLVQASPDVIWRMDADGRFLFVSERALDLWGWTTDEIIGNHFAFLVAEDSLEYAASEWITIQDPSLGARRYRFVCRRKDGTKILTELSSIAVFEDGVFVGAQGTIRDISERERLERELRESEERYRGLVQSSPDLIWRNDAEGRFTFMAEGAEQLFGWSADELVGRHFSEILAPESLEDGGEAWYRLTTNPGAVWRLRFVLVRKDGSRFAAEVSAVTSFEDGTFRGAQGTMRDVEERERLERELRESEERYRSVIQSSPDLIWATNKSGRYVFVSDRVRDLLGWQPEEVLGHPFREFIDERSVEMTTENWARLAMEPGVTQTHRIDIRHKDGSLRPFEVSSVAVVRDGEVENVYGIARDIGERERLERELRESEERYRFLVENSPDVIYATDAEGVITYFSESVERSLGWTPQEVIGRHFRDIVRSQSGEPAGRRFTEMAKGRPDLTTRMELLDKSGVYRPFEVTAAAMRIDGVFSGVHGSARDIRERERLERELRDSEERYRYLVQASPDLVWMTDADGAFTFVSDQARQILGWEPDELLRRSFADLSPAAARRGALARFRFLQRRPTEVHRSRLNVLARDGRELAMEITGIGMVADGRFLGAHGAARDVSERERLERGLRRQAAELASSEERAHLARELHDSVTQALFSMTLLSRSIELLLVKDPAQVPEKLVSLRELQRDALAEMRALIFELRPGNIEEHGLIQALRTHSASLSGRIGLPVVVEADLPERPPIEIEETLYRIAQEALHNVVKHAGARQVRLEVGRVPEGVRLRVIDDGRGFDPDAVPDGHLGITGMRSRAERLGGHLSVTTGKGTGTTIEVVVPETVPAGLADADRDG